MKNLEGFVDTLNTEDKSLFIKMISECYHRFHKSIQAESANDRELFYSLIMALLIEQSKEIERLESTQTR